MQQLTNLWQWVTYGTLLCLSKISQGKHMGVKLTRYNPPLKQQLPQLSLIIALVTSIMYLHHYDDTYKKNIHAFIHVQIRACFSVTNFANMNISWCTYVHVCHQYNNIINKSIHKAKLFLGTHVLISYVETPTVSDKFSAKSFRIHMN